MSETCLIFGASSWIAQRFIKKAKSVANLRILEIYRGGNMTADERVIGDPLDYEFVNQLIKSEKPSQIINFCGVALSDDRVDEMEAINVNISKNILRSIQNNYLNSRLIALGSAAEYGVADSEVISESCHCDPVSQYGKTKLRQTKLVLESESCVANRHLIVRPFNLVGVDMPESIIAHTLWSKAKEVVDGEDLDLFFPEMVRDFLDVDDAVTGILSLMKSNEGNAIFNLSSGNEISYKSFIKAMLSALNKKCTVIQSPHMMGKPALVPSAVGSSMKLKQSTGWTAGTSLAMTFQKILKHER